MKDIYHPLTLQTRSESSTKGNVVTHNVDQINGSQILSSPVSTGAEGGRERGGERGERNLTPALSERGEINLTQAQRKTDRQTEISLQL